MNQNEELRERRSVFTLEERCQSKCAYPTRGKAMRVLGGLRAKGVPMGAAYKCPLCHDWHLTKQSNRKARKENQPFG